MAAKSKITEVSSRIPKLNLQNAGPKIMVIALVVMAFTIGMLWQKVQNLQSGSTTLGAQTNASPAAAAAAPAGPKVTLDQVKELWSKDLIKFGDTNKKLLFVEVGDPSCPFCHAAGGENHSIYQSLGGSSFKLIADGGTYDSPVLEMRKLIDNGQASFVYVYYPGHGNGEMGMKSLYCANEKGKFWQVHDLLMSDAGYNLMNNTVKNDKTQSQVVADFLKSAVDPSFLKSCLDSGKYDQRLGADMTIAGGLGISGTPGFIINDTVYPGAYSWGDMKTTVDTALK